jgi:hypothetical protein
MNHYTCTTGFYPRLAFTRRGSRFCFVVVVIVGILLSNFTRPCMLSAVLPCPAALPGSLTRQPCPAALLSSLARQPCPAALSGSLPRQPSPAELPYSASVFDKLPACDVPIESLKLTRYLFLFLSEVIFSLVDNNNLLQSNRGFPLTIGVKGRIKSLQRKLKSPPHKAKRG